MTVLFRARASKASRLAVGLTLLSAVSLVITACGGKSGSSSKDGGMLTMATWSATQSLDPAGAAGTGNSGGAELAALYDTIMTYDSTTGKFTPHMAKSLTANAAFTVWTLKLKPGIKFTDGTDFNAEAVVYNLKRQVEMRSRSASLITPIAKYETPDPLTVVFTLSAPWNNFPYALASDPGMIASPTAIKKEGKDFGTHPVGAGAGPFMFESFSAGESVILKRNPNYWDGSVPLDEVKFISVGDGPKTYEAFKGGSVDLAFLRDAGAEADAKADGAGGFTVTYSANDTLIMNNGIPITCQGGEPADRCKGKADGTVLKSDSPTADVRVRRAVAAAINLDTLNQRVYNGDATMTSDLIAKGSRWYDGVAGPQYNLAEAKSLVAEAEQDGWDGHIRVSCHTGLPTWGPAVKGMLEAAGFKVDLTDQQQIAANTTAVIVHKDFDLACFGSTISDAAPFFAINRDFNSANLAAGGGDYSGYKNPEVDAAIAKGRAASSDSEVKAAITTVAQAYSRDVPFLALSAQAEVVLVSKSVKGVTLNANTVVDLAKAHK
jgi:peptide/nickel transport system substrate-binding protein